MNKVQDVISNLENEIQELVNKKSKLNANEKKDLLFSLGLFEKKYSQDNHSTNEYPYQDFDGKVTKYYKFSALDISDEDYKKILLLQAQKEQLENNVKDKDDNVFKYISYIISLFIFVIYFAIGLKAIFNYDSDGVIIMFSGFVSGCLFIGIGEILKLLVQIKNKQ